MTTSVLHSPRPVVAIVGRPNVGKSTLVNRIVGSREAIEAERPGVTRDRKVFEADWSGRVFDVVDTGGWERAPSDSLAEAVCRQAEAAIDMADLVVLVVDAAVGVTDEDVEVARLLRKFGDGRVLVAANKVDSSAAEPAAAEFYSLGLGEVYPVSALHGRESGRLLDAIVAALPEETTHPQSAEEKVPSVAIVGRPNAGKSTLFNALVGEARSIVDEQPGTTRDAVDELVELGGRVYRFVDTAGMRKRSRVFEEIDFYSNVRAAAAIDRADLVVLVIDSSEGATQQDQQLARRILSGGCGIVIALNKWDLGDAESREKAVESVRDRLRFLDFAPVVRTSGMTGRGLDRIPPLLEQVLTAYRARVPTAELNASLSDAERHHPAPAGKRGRRPRILYGTQAATEPPTFVLFATARFDRSYLSYLERWLREHLDLGPTPIRMRVRTRERKGRSGTRRSKGGGRG